MVMVGLKGGFTDHAYTYSQILCISTMTKKEGASLTVSDCMLDFICICYDSNTYVPTILCAFYYAPFGNSWILI